MLESLFNKFAGLKGSNLLKTGIQHKYFPVNIAKFRKSFFNRTPLVAISELPNLLTIVMKRNLLLQDDVLLQRKLVNE